MKQTPLSLYAENLLNENIQLQGQGKKQLAHTIVPAHSFHLKDGSKSENEAFKLTTSDAEALLLFRSKLTVASKVELEDKNYAVQIELAKAFSEKWNS